MFLFQIMKLDIESVAGQRAFLFLWCGSGEGLDFGRMVSISELIPVLYVQLEACASLDKSSLLGHLWMK